MAIRQSTLPTRCLSRTCCLRDVGRGTWLSYSCVVSDPSCMAAQQSRRPRNPNLQHRHQRRRAPVPIRRPNLHRLGTRPKHHKAHHRRAHQRRRQDPTRLRHVPAILPDQETAARLERLKAAWKVESENLFPPIQEVAVMEKRRKRLQAATRAGFFRQVRTHDA